MNKSPLMKACTGLLAAMALLLGCRGNKAPAGAEVPSGPGTAYRNSIVAFRSSATDPNRDSVAVRFDWGDDDTSAWSAFLAGGTVVADSHAWSVSDTYFVRAQAKDVAGLVSRWSQPLAVVVVTGWAKTYGGTWDDEGLAVLQTADSGLVATGCTHTYGGAELHFCLIKTDAFGSQEWNKTLGTTEEGYGYSVLATPDRGYVVAGTSPTHIYLFRTDADGNTIWVKTFGGPDENGYAMGYSVQPTRDGGYIIVGEAGPFTGGWSDAYVIKTDADGNRVWTKTFGGAYSDVGWSVVPTSDGAYAITGYSENSSGGADIWLVKIDESGNQLWTKTFARPGYGCGYSVAATSDGGFVITGCTTVGGDWDVCLIRADAQGNQVWAKTFGGALADEGRAVKQTADGGFVIAGQTKSFGAGSFDAYMLKTDANGDTMWTRTYGGAGDDYGNSVQVTADGGYIICGTTSSFGAGSGDVWLIKTDSQGNVGP